MKNFKTYLKRLIIITIACSSYLLIVNVVDIYPFDTDKLEDMGSEEFEEWFFSMPEEEQQEILEEEQRQIDEKNRWKVIEEEEEEDCD
jgi:hypothetical protein